MDGPGLDYVRQTLIGGLQYGVKQAGRRVADRHRIP